MVLSHSSYGMGSSIGRKRLSLRPGSEWRYRFTRALCPGTGSQRILLSNLRDSSVDDVAKVGSHAVFPSSIPYNN